MRLITYETLLAAIEMKRGSTLDLDELAACVADTLANIVKQEGSLLFQDPEGNVTLICPQEPI
jgi:hypothetical protein